MPELPETPDSHETADFPAMSGDEPAEQATESTDADEDTDEATADEDALSEAVGDVEEVAAEEREKSKPKAILCPYCGHMQGQRNQRNTCDQCGGLFEPLSRKATQIAMGPWYLRDQRHPFRPGCSFDVILRLVEQNKISATTVIRGPTTRQFWSIARNVPGLAHRLGYCHSCRGHIDKGLDKCPLCDAEFKTPPHRNELGLLYPNGKAAEAAQRSLDRQLALVRGDDLVGFDQNGDPVDHHPEPAQPPADPAPADTAAESQKSGADVDSGALLDDVLGIQTTARPRTSEPEAPRSTPPPPPEPPQASTSPTTSSVPDAPPLPAPQPAPEPVAPLRAPHPNDLPAVQPAKPLVVWLLIALNVMVALAIVLYFVLRNAGE